MTSIKLSSLVLAVIRCPLALPEDHRRSVLLRRRSSACDSGAKFPLICLRVREISHSQGVLRDDIKALCGARTAKPRVSFSSTFNRKADHVALKKSHR